MGLAEAKNKLSELIDRVSEGEEITITRHDQAVAKLVPLKRTSRAELRKVIEQIRALRARNPASLTPKEIIAFKNEGRR